MERLCPRKADFERIKYAYSIWKNSKFTELTQCYKKPSDAKLDSYFEHKYYVRKIFGAYDFRIINASINIYTFGFKYLDENSNEIFCYVLPTRTIHEYVSNLI